MSRIARLELVVRNLADRILGETITFDEIAEQEAAEQGVAYTPPAAQAQGIDPDVLALIEERLKESPSQPVVPTAELDELRERLSAFDRRYVQQEQIIQTLIQAADALLQRLASAEGRLDQHRDVINQNREFNLSAFIALSDAADSKIRKVG